MPYFPNFLSLASPYAFIGLNFFNTMEYQMRHMDRLLREVEAPRRARPSRSPRRPTHRFLDQMTELVGDSVFTVGNCADARSYYFNPHGEATLLRPMTATCRDHAQASDLPAERLPASAENPRGCRCLQNV